MQDNYLKRCKADFRPATRETEITCPGVVIVEANFGTDSEADPYLLARNESVERATAGGMSASRNDCLNP